MVALTSEALADLLDDIARADVGSPPTGGPDEIDAVIRLVEALGAVRRNVATGQAAPVSESAAVFVRSLAEHIRHDSPALHGWERAVPESAAPDDPPNGPRLTLSMENARSRWNDPHPLRRTEVAQVVIKGELRWRRGKRFLVRWDDGAHAFQLVGGHRRQGDLAIDETIRREIAEEVPGLVSSFPPDSVTKFDGASVVQVSRTHGALTAYEMSFFQASFSTTRPVISQTDRWVTAQELLEGRTEDGRRINQTGLVRAVPDLARFLDETPTSFSRARISPPRKVTITLFLGALGFLASVAGLVQFVAWIAG